MCPKAEPDSDPGPISLTRMIAAAAHVLPAQGPIGVFIHHNTLHSFEDLPFETAVMSAADLYGCEPFLREEDYRTLIGSGRIRETDVAAVLRDELGPDADDRVAGAISRCELRRRVATYGIPGLSGTELSWVLSETDALSRFRTDIPTDAREIAQASADIYGGRKGEVSELNALWGACRRQVTDVQLQPAISLVRKIRFRDLILDREGIDTDLLVHPLLIRFVAAYLDQGLAMRSMPRREAGIYSAFLRLYQAKWSSWSDDWTANLPAAVRDEIASGSDALASVARSLTALGVPEQEWQEYLVATLLALRGWGGMVRQFEERPDRVPHVEVPARVGDFLAVRLLLERIAISYALHHRLGLKKQPGDLRAQWMSEEPSNPVDRRDELAWQLFSLSQLCGFSSFSVERFSPEQTEDFLIELEEFSPVQRRRVLHLAYERNLRRRFYDALVHQPIPTAQPQPDWQAIFCIDEREESIRRHLEAADPGVETLGAAGYFGVAMYYRGVSEAHPRPLCPVAISPSHMVVETEGQTADVRGAWRRFRRRGAGWYAQTVHHGTRTLFLGAVLAPVVGAFSVVPLVLRVVAPWLGHRLHSMSRSTGQTQRTRLVLASTESATAASHSGYSVSEMTDIVREQLENLGIVRRLARLVVVMGHGSISLNNPHESAHDCGACGGGRGGPNARAFAGMANRPDVRAHLQAAGLSISPDTWFIGAEHNTCNDAVMYYDEDLVPASHRELLTRAQQAMHTARIHNAHERCRRFEHVPAWYPPTATLHHVEARATDLAQPRPEYGHATNAYCIIGRRARTDTLFFDRRAFLTSYDPACDPDGLILSRTLAAVIPVVAGINLEYYFSYVDPQGYGCQTKLPHNVTALLGIMDGMQSDLRTGLPWQMVEIHEPVRLIVAVECRHDALVAAIEHNSSICRLVNNNWLRIASLDPDRAVLWEVGTPAPYVAEQPPLRIVDDPRAWYGGRRGHLPLVSFVGKRVKDIVA